ncbi:MAG: AMP-binding protein [Bacteroidales bacterium]|nr:AMP-binding protein [Bacteroidales bacterium]MCF8389448.1 AMP-binding protein [Bacteroidales bacterium]
MKTLVQFLEGNVAKYGDNPYMWEKRDGKFQPTSYNEIRELIHQFGAGLHLLGIKKGDRMALLAEGRTLWVVAEMGMFFNGAIDVPLSIQLNEPEDLTFRLKHSESKMIVVSESQAKKLDPIKKFLPDLEKVILLDPKEKYEKDEIFIGDIMEKGKKFLVEKPGEFQKIYESVQPDDVANICYTSGTTADPKGIMLTHRNYTSNTEQALSVTTIPSDWVMFLFLPWDHSFAHTSGIFTMMSVGASLAALEMGKTGFETRKNIFKNIQEIKPQLMFSVPTIAKNFRSNIESGVRAKGKLTWSLFSAGLNIAYRYNGIGIDKGKGFNFLLKPLYALFDALVFSKVRNALGGNMQFFIGGGALLDIELQKFFYAIGVPMYQGYGLTEASPMLSINSPERHKLGASGVIPEEITIKIADSEGNQLPTGEKGEILVRGENVMKGYWKNETATTETLADGWLHSGDMGYVDADGFLYVLGRYKSLLIADDGEKYSPEGIEEAFTDQSEIIEQCLLHNNQNPYTIALVYPNREALLRQLKSKGLTADSREGIEAAIELIDNEIREYRSKGKFGDMFPQRWIPTTIGILGEGFTVENKMMNPSLKVVRPKVEENNSGLFEFLYTSESKNVKNERNIESMRKVLEG